MLMLLIILAQPVPQPQFKPVEAGFQDVSLLANSLRLEPLDLHSESDFSRVYEVEIGTRLFGHRPARLFARRAGGLTAVFPQSSYRPVGEGLLRADIPNDTVFLIGDEPTRLLGEPAPEAPSPARADLLADLRISEAASVDQPDSSAKTPPPRRLAPPESKLESIWTNPEYRASRIASLLDRALSRRP